MSVKLNSGGNPIPKVSKFIDESIRVYGVSQEEGVSAHHCILRLTIDFSGPRHLLNFISFNYAIRSAPLHSHTMDLIGLFIPTAWSTITHARHDKLTRSIAAELLPDDGDEESTNSSDADVI
ncbi:hypothetical protein PT974_02897 [Cladobotryum mycophilum]|uniref:Uncharacterized protein n=1 Tax=Cladobotryum mycophilum TaxID=491253 RepID=A0ABR0SZX7_9HYPO